jgi:hypothetical protein
MKSQALPEFWKSFDRLPPKIQAGWDSGHFRALFFLSIMEGFA